MRRPMSSTQAATTTSLSMTAKRRKSELHRLHDHPDELLRPHQDRQFQLHRRLGEYHGADRGRHVSGHCPVSGSACAKTTARRAPTTSGATIARASRASSTTPGRSLLYNGGGSVEQVGTCMQIVARRVEFSGNSRSRWAAPVQAAGLRGHTGGGWHREAGGMMPGILQRLRRDQRGTAIIELALVAPILAVLIMGAVDVGGAFSRRLALEQGAQRAVEKVHADDRARQCARRLLPTRSRCRRNVDDGSRCTVTFPRYCNDRLMADAERDEETGLAEGEPCEDGETEAHYIMVDVADEYEPVFAVIRHGNQAGERQLQDSEPRQGCERNEEATVFARRSRRGRHRNGICIAGLDHSCYGRSSSSA